jgi:predicted O-methyltransferase YrrM
MVQTPKMKALLTTNDKITFYQMKFQDFFQNFDKKFDLIYIDGDHSYESVLRDIEQSLSMLVNGGLLSGHDHNSNFPGVIEAVNKIFNSKEVEVFSDSSWILKVNNELQ